LAVGRCEVEGADLVEARGTLARARVLAVGGCEMEVVDLVEALGASEGAGVLAVGGCEIELVDCIMALGETEGAVVEARGVLTRWIPANLVTRWGQEGGGPRGSLRIDRRSRTGAMAEALIPGVEGTGIGGTPAGFLLPLLPLRLEGRWWAIGAPAAVKEGDGSSALWGLVWLALGGGGSSELESDPGLLCFSFLSFWVDHISSMACPVLRMSLMLLTLERGIRSAYRSLSPDTRAFKTVRGESMRR
jgi:hypothetical protein